MSWVTLQTCGRIPPGTQFSMRWRKWAKLGMVSRLFARGTRNRSSSSLGLVNCRWLRLWVCTGGLLSVHYSCLYRRVSDSMRLQALLWTYLPIAGKMGHVFAAVTFSPPFRQSSVMRTSITTRVRYVTKNVCGWPACVDTPASDSAMNPVEIASSHSPMSPCHVAM